MPELLEGDTLHIVNVVQPVHHCPVVDQTLLLVACVSINVEDLVVAKHQEEPVAAVDPHQEAIVLCAVVVRRGFNADRLLFVAGVQEVFWQDLDLLDPSREAPVTSSVFNVQVVVLGSALFLHATEVLLNLVVWPGNRLGFLFFVILLLIIVFVLFLDALQLFVWLWLPLRVEGLLDRVLDG